MLRARRRLALVALLLLAVAGSATVAAASQQVASDGHPPSATRFIGPDALANGLVIGTAPKGAARGAGTTSSKRQARSTFLAALGGTLGVVALRRRRLPHGADHRRQLLHQLTRLSRAPPGLAPTHS